MGNHDCKGDLGIVIGGAHFPDDHGAPGVKLPLTETGAEWREVWGGSDLRQVWKEGRQPM